MEPGFIGSSIFVPKQKSEKRKSQKQILYEQFSSTNTKLDQLNQNFSNFLKVVESNNSKLNVVTDQVSTICSTGIPTTEDITKIVNERLSEEKKKEAYNAWFTQLSEDVKSDLIWIEKYLDIDRYKAKDFYLEFVKRLNTRAQRNVEQSRPQFQTEPEFQKVEDQDIK